MRKLAIGLVLLALAAPLTAHAATTQVSVVDNAFDPSSTTLAVGDTVHWSRAQDSVRPHTVTANGGFWDTPCNPCVGGIDLSARPSAGTFHYYCKVHGSPDGSPSEGMNGYVRVPVTITEAPMGPAFTVRWATTSTNTGSSFDVQYRVGSGSWHTWRSKTQARKGVFGKDGDPVTVATGKRYSFRARSRKGDAKSRYSPVASFTPLTP